MEYQKIIDIIENKRRFGNLPGVVISKKLLAAVGDPQKDLKFVHIAGTNGKGSTAAFLRSILTAAGIKTGMFTSPHLIDFTERIQIDGKQIPKEDVVRIGSRLLELELEVHPTMFDYCFAMAMLYFKEQSCEIVVLETGLGGRLDATNAIDVPLVSIITKIGYDHTAVLGNTLEEIAAEKAGILKKGTYAVMESQEQEALDVLLEQCKELQIPYVVEQPEKIKKTENGFSYQHENVSDTTSYEMRMQGNHQSENALAAILAAKALKDQGYPVTDAAMHQGILEAFWPGRMELISENPFLMIDGAHNGHGVRALAKSLASLYPGEKFHFIMGVLADKDYTEMFDLIAPLAEDVITLTPESSRALQGADLAEYIRQQGIEAENRENISDVFAPFMENTKECRNGKTIAFGSLYFIGEIRKFFSLNPVDAQ